MQVRIFVETGKYWNLQTINFFEAEKHTFEMRKRSFENRQLDLAQYGK